MERATNIQSVFDGMADRIKPEQAAGISAVVQFDLSGDGGGQWQAKIENGTLTFGTGAAPNPNVTMSATAGDFLAMVNGDLKPATAFMMGKARIKGDMALIMRLQSLFVR